jgi:hypothetical protein
MFHSLVLETAERRPGESCWFQCMQRLVRLAYRNRPLLCWNTTGIRGWIDEESIYDFTNFVTVFVENIRNVSVMLQWCCIVLCFASTTLRVKLVILHSLRTKEKKKAILFMWSREYWLSAGQVFKSIYSSKRVNTLKTIQKYKISIKIEHEN